MKLFQTASALLILATSSAVFAANLTIPMSFEYLAIDGKRIETNKFTHQKDLALTPGSHKIALRYHDIIEDDYSDSQSFVKSAPLILTLNVDEGQQYKLVPITGSVNNPKIYAKAPKISIVRQDKQAVDYSVIQTQIEERSFFDELFANKSEPVIASSTQVPAVVTVTSAAETRLATAPKVATKLTSSVKASEAQPRASVPEQSPEEHAQKMLQYWWLQADDKTRKEFMGWAIKQL
jgi:uncharacterized protein